MSSKNIEQKLRNENYEWLERWITTTKTMNLLTRIKTLNYENMRLIFSKNKTSTWTLNFFCVVDSCHERFSKMIMLVDYANKFNVTLTCT